MTTEATDPELQRMLDAIAKRYNSDESFKREVKETVNKQSQSFLEKLVHDIIGFVAGTVLKGIMKALTSLFR